MKKKVSVLLLSGAAVIISTNHALADTITKPYIFTDGTPALASEVNADFDTVYAQVNKMGSLITVDDIYGIMNVSGSIALENETHTSFTTTSYADTDAYTGFIGRRARGSKTSPSAVLTGDSLVRFGGIGYTPTTGWSGVPGSPYRAMMRISASEDWTDSAQGANFIFETTANGETSRGERMRITDAGDVGIGTTTPAGTLELASEFYTSGLAALYVTSYYNDASNHPAHIYGRRARGTMGTPSPVLNGDSIFMLGPIGYDGGDITNGFSRGYNASIGFNATEDFSLTGTGTNITFSNTANGSTSRVERMRIDQNGNVGIGTTTPERNLDIVADYAETGGVASLGVTTYYDSHGHPTQITGLKARGSKTAPAPLLQGDKILSISGKGYDGDSFGPEGPTGPVASMQFIATENYTSSTKGSAILFYNTPNGEATRVEHMRIEQNGNVGIGTPTPQATLDINGFMRLAKNAFEPVTCDATSDGSLALTTGNRMCVCDGATSTWVFTSDGTTSCQW